ncbi:dihydrolipoyl dehydrogenase [Mycoplasmopsis alligatoris]|uniref:Dihydrolipoyl dehydrogenase n=1 Tax=Mycoplasmopsis alligatoris A21JP2 TaxID=747682 RepID=D4XUV9_9BACT|nr:dihydrolipoyl dehydrogenase [Mycoplasmopsis alligatoris]EFF41874.1 dihydrolipoyl dehydrogenase [Mycoplasmopsis alligatoris A21JP2]
MYKFKFADIGEGLHEGNVAEIFVKEGDKVKEGDSLFSVETDKVTSDIPCPVTGTIKSILMKEGETIHVGQEIFVIDDGSGPDTSASATVNEAPAASSTSAPVATSTSFYSFKFADIGEGLHEGNVAQIFFKEGDKVNEGDSLFSVETDKVTSDIPSPVTGTIKSILMKEGETIHVGQEIFLIDDGKSYASSAPAAKNDSSEAASVVGEMKVNNDLIDFSAFAAAPAVSEAPKVESPQMTTPQSNTTKSAYVGEEGKVYTGSIKEEYDVIVIGSGPGGYLAAEEAGKSGLKTMIIERWKWGGVCLNTGCIPTKALLKSTEAIHELKHSKVYGVVANFDDLKIDYEKTWTNIHERKDNVVNKVANGVKMLMKSSKVKTIEGEAHFVGAREIEVNGDVYRTKNVIIATGSRAKRLDMIEGFAEGYESGQVITSKKAINHSVNLPKTIVIIGGGVIGVEFAQIFALSGTKVTLLQNSDRILPMADPDVSKEASKGLEAMGVKILYNVQTNKLVKKELHYTHDGKEHKVKPELILTATGRGPVSAGLAEVGVKLGKIGEVLVDKHQRTNVRGVYAIGDVTGQNMLAHVAYAHALAAIFTILGDKEKSKYDPKGVPGCIYISPEISFIGKTESEAKAEGRDVFSSKYLFDYLGKSVATTNTQGFIKLVVDKEYGEILGASIVGPNSTDYISQIGMAMDQEISVHEIAHTIHPHPTYNEIIWEAARSASLKLTLDKK